jgi:hypothetical protein
LKNTINLFMWGYQPHYRFEIHDRARTVLELIAPDESMRSGPAFELQKPQMDTRFAWSLKTATGILRCTSVNNRDVHYS